MLSPTNSPFFQSDLHAVVCNKFAITDKPLHKHDSNKYQSKAFFICNQRSFQTRFVTYVNKTCWVWVMYWSLLINSTSTAPIRSCVRGQTQFFKMVGFLRQTFPSLPPPPHPSFLFFALVPTFSMNWCKTLAMQAVTTEDYKHKLKCENGLENDTGTQYFSTCHGSQNGHSFGCWVIFKNLNHYLFWILMFDQF